MKFGKSSGSSHSSPASGDGGPGLINRAMIHFGMSGSAEVLAAVILFALMLALKCANVFAYRFDSDETQHLHIIWGWSRGFVQYRDLFDNHMPLFHLFFAPIFALFGERTSTLFWMRLTMWPEYMLSAWVTYRTASILFSRRVGLWAVILSGCYSDYFFYSLEFRADNLWAALWLLAVLTLVSGRMSPRRALTAGLLLSFCFGVSIKTSLLLLALLASAAIAIAIALGMPNATQRRRIIRCAISFFAALPIVPGIIAIVFALSGAWAQFHYCVLQHNALAHFYAERSQAWWIFLFLIALPSLIATAWAINRVTLDRSLGFRRAFFLLICGFYVITLYSLWAIPNRQNFLPFHPLAFVIYAGAFFALLERLPGDGPRISALVRRLPLPAALAAMELCLILRARPLWIDGTRPEIELLRDVLLLTKPTDYVIDCKGETVFRQRCVYSVMEKMTLARIERGLDADDVAQRCIETRTCLAAMMGRMPSEARRFVHENYLRVGPELRVAGFWLTPKTPQENAITFDVLIAASYELVGRNGQATGFLDGTPYEGARSLSAGRHTFVRTSVPQRLALLWSPAVARNFSPFQIKKISGSRK
jgi:hypothetical protein